MTAVLGLDQAYTRCEEITRQEAKNFAYGIRLLRPPERRALSAVYALARRIDDIGDGEGSAEEKARGLEGVRSSLHELEHEHDTQDPVLIAIRDAHRRYDLPMLAFFELVEGCEMDVAGTRYETRTDLVVYCRRVAGSIGRLSLAIFGSYHVAGAPELADDLGVALQLTNILRDVAEDRRRGRVYLPASDAAAFGCPPDLSDAPSLARLVAFECERTEEWFSRGLGLLGVLDRRSRACVGAMSGIYHRILRRIARDPGVVARERVSLSTPEKLSVALRCLAPRPAPRAGRPAIGDLEARL